MTALGADTGPSVPTDWPRWSPGQRTAWIRDHPEVTDRRRRIAAAAAAAEAVAARPGEPPWAHLDPEQRADLARRLYRQGCSTTSVGNATGLTATQLGEIRAEVREARKARRAARRGTTPVPPGTPGHARAADVAPLAAQGMTVEEIAARLEVSPRRVRSALVTAARQARH